MSGILQPIEVVSSMSTTTNTRFTFNFKGAISKNWPSSSKQTSLTTSCSCRQLSQLGQLRVQRSRWEWLHASCQHASFIRFLCDTTHIFIITSKLSFLYILLILLDHFLNVKCNMSKIDEVLTCCTFETGKMTPGYLNKDHTVQIHTQI